jgi:hypothetical protein
MRRNGDRKLDLSNLVKTVSQYAPLLGSILPIPGGAAIGELIAHEFGGSTSDPEGLVNLINTTPDAQVKIVEIQSNCKIQLQQMWVAYQQTLITAQTAQIESDNADTQDARKNVAVSNMPSIMTFIIIIGFFVVLGCLILYAANIPPNVSSVLYMMVGTINSAFGGAFTFWLGSSASSRSKDLAIHNTLANLSSQSAAT